MRLAAEILADIAGREDPLEQLLYLDTHLFLPDSLLLYGDKMSMASSLEQRVPFLDLELMRFVQRIPARLRVRHLRRKWLYRRAMRGFVPDAVMRPAQAPVHHPLRRVAAHLALRRAGVGAGVEPGAARARGPGSRRGGWSAEHRAGRADNKRILYCLLELAVWHATFIERSPELVAA